MAPTRLGPGSFMSIGLVAMIVSLAFWVGSNDGRTTTRLDQHDEKIRALETIQSEERRALASRLDVMSQDLAAIKAELKGLASGPRR